MLGTHLYTEDNIRNLLDILLPEENFVIFNHILLNNEELLNDSINSAIRAVRVGGIAVLPININNNHWVGAIIRQNGDRIQFIYNDPLGNALDSRLAASLRMIGVEIIDLQIEQQRTAHDCGPYVVNNLTLLAQQRAEANIEEMRDILGGNVEPSLREDAAPSLREAHARILHHIAEDFPSGPLLLTENPHLDIATPDVHDGYPRALACCMIVSAIVIVVGVAGVFSMINDHEV